MIRCSRRLVAGRRFSAVAVQHSNGWHPIGHACPKSQLHTSSRVCCLNASQSTNQNQVGLTNETRGGKGEGRFSWGAVAVGAAVGGAVVGWCLSGDRRSSQKDDDSGRQNKRFPLQLPSVNVLSGAVKQITSSKASQVDQCEVSREVKQPVDALQSKSRNHSKSLSAKKPKASPMSLEEKVNASRKLLLQVKEETGSPGLVVCVSIDGHVVMEEGLGYADLENDTPCHAHSVMRIASISKSMTAAIIGRLVEKGELDLDLPIQHYVPEFPQKTWEGKPVIITSRHLLCHQSGIRHYDTELDGNFVQFNQKYFDSSTKALDIFKDADLKHAPGAGFTYSTYGYTLLSAVAEKASGKTFPQLLTQLTSDLGMTATRTDCNKRIVYNRTRFYFRSRSGSLANASYVDCSYKWAGGGILSSAPDVVNFANSILYSLQQDPNNPEALPGLLKRETVLELLAPRKQKEKRRSEYGYGWMVVPDEQKIGCGRQEDLQFGHTGGATGASSMVWVVPTKPRDNGTDSGPMEEDMAVALLCDEGMTSGLAVLSPDSHPKGIVIGVIVNLADVNLTNVAKKIAKIFQAPDTEKEN